MRALETAKKQIQLQRWIGNDVKISCIVQWAQTESHE